MQSVCLWGNPLNFNDDKSRIQFLNRCVDTTKSCSHSDPKSHESRNAGFSSECIFYCYLFHLPVKAAKGTKPVPKSTKAPAKAADAKKAPGSQVKKAQQAMKKVS